MTDWYKIKRILVRQNWEEKQVYPAENWNNLDISKATLSKQFSTWYWFQWLYINPDENVAMTASFGSTWYVRGYSYTNKDISTATLTGTNTGTPQAHAVFANKTWTHIYVWLHWNMSSSHHDWAIYEYNTSNFSVSGMTSYKNKSFWHVVQTIWTDVTETYLIVFWDNTSSQIYIYLYQMTTPWDVSTATLVKSISAPFNCHWLFFNNEMTKCVACKYDASSWTVYQYDRDILNSNTYTQTHSFWPVWFTIGYANINKWGTTMYASRENWYIYQYKLS
jgi:hypothetical protein